MQLNQKEITWFHNNKFKFDHIQNIGKLRRIFCFLFSSKRRRKIILQSLKHKWCQSFFFHFFFFLLLACFWLVFFFLVFSSHQRGGRKRYCEVWNTTDVNFLFPRQRRRRRRKVILRNLKQNLCQSWKHQQKVVLLFKMSHINQNFFSLRFLKIPIQFVSI